MNALITGASSGIGKEIALYLSSFGYNLYVVSQNKEELLKIYKNLKVKITAIELDLSKIDDCKKLYQMLKDKDIDLLVNNAGFGDAGNFVETSLEKEMKMIDLNIKAYHILTKLFLKDFTQKNRGRILNVASFAGMMPGPYMATYYATKSYIVNLSLAISKELLNDKSNVKISIFCPGPVSTNFEKKANVIFKIKKISAQEAAKIAVNGMFKNKKIIIPRNMQFNRLLIKIAPIKLILSINSLVQERKTSISK